MVDIVISMSKSDGLFAYGEVLRPIGMFCRKRLNQRIPGNLSPHFNSGIEICVVHKGVFRWQVEGKIVEIGPGEASMTLPWQEHGGVDDCLEIGELSWIILDVDLNKKGLNLGPWSDMETTAQQQLWQELCRADHAFLGKVEGLERIFHAIQQELLKQDYGWQWMIWRRLDELLLLLLRHFLKGPAESSPSSHLLQDLCAGLEKDLTHPWTLNEMAEAMSLSRSSLVEKLRKASGYSPMELLTRLRLLRAKEMLLQDKFSVLQIALKCGFSTSQYFSSVFRKFEGLSPMQYKKVGKGGKIADHPWGVGVKNCDLRK